MQFLCDSSYSGLILTRLVELHVWYATYLHHDLSDMVEIIFSIQILLFPTESDVTVPCCLPAVCPGNMQAEPGHQQPEASSFHDFTSTISISRLWKVFKKFLIAKSNICDNISTQRILIIQNNDAKNSEFWAEAKLSVLYATVMLLLPSEHC